MIKQFKISKLFGFRNVNISFASNKKILIGENGLGKTTILNSLYYLLSKKFHKLAQIDFETIMVKFSNSDSIEFSKEDLVSYLNFEDRRNSNIRKKISSILDITEISITDIENEVQTRKEIDDYISRKPEIRRLAPLSIIRREIASLLYDLKFNKLSEFIKIIDKNVDDILYFPTYRRVEEELKNLGKYSRHHLMQRTPFEEFEDLDEEDQEEIDIDDDTLIHFGMEDVRIRIEKIVSEIKQSSIVGFSKVTGEMLSQLLKGFPTIEDKDIEKLDTNTVKIVVHRVGHYLNTKDRETILSLLENLNELKKKKELVYFIFKLIDIYAEQKHLDDSIKKFKDACNNYLVDKEFRYNESLVELKIFRVNTNDDVALSKLSSGEKQIVSLFSKLYFEQFKNLIILFDEPELSLSIEWQKQLLPDIVSSQKCNFLLAVTHSPFIFKNGLEKYAIGMNVYVK